jgi:hypothetical protein
VERIAWMTCFRHLARNYQGLAEMLVGLYFAGFAMLLAQSP